MSEPPRELFRHWIHSREEDAGGVTVYRPSIWDFPPARGRRGFEVKPDGGFVRYDIAPADGVRAVVGLWTIAGPGRVAVSFDDPRENYTLEILACDATVLRVRILMT